MHNEYIDCHISYLNGLNRSLLLEKLNMAFTSGPFFEKKCMKRYPIISLQIMFYQIDYMHE